MRYYGDQVLMKGGQIAYMPTKELIREIDAEAKENDCIANKFKGKD